MSIKVSMYVLTLNIWLTTNSLPCTWVKNSKSTRTSNVLHCYRNTVKCQSYLENYITMLNEVFGSTMTLTNVLRTPGLA